MKWKDEVSFMRLLFISILFTWVSPALGADVLILKGGHAAFNMTGHVLIFEDTTSALGVEDVRALFDDGKFQAVDGRFLNFGLTRSTCWIYFGIKNNDSTCNRYNLQVNNFDIDELGFFMFDGDSLIRRCITGELYPVETRDVFDARFVFNLQLDTGVKYDCFISSNTNGHANFLPMHLYCQKEFDKASYISEMINWFIYGILFFIIVFNLYLYRSTKTRSILFYSIYVLFAIMVLATYDGYLSLLITSEVFHVLKWYTAVFYAIFLLLFVRAFVFGDPVDGYRNSKIMPIVIVLLFLPLISLFPYPYNMIVYFAIPAIVLLIQLGVIVVGYFSIRLNDLPSRMFVYAYCIIFVGFLLHELKEINVLPANWFFINILKITFLLESIILTIVVLERNRLELLYARTTIEHNYKQIEIQNKELELINLELEKLSLIASETKNSVAICDVSGRIEWCNNGFSKFYDVTLDELISTGEDTLDKVIPNEKMSGYLKTCVEKSRVIIFETLAKTKRRKEIWVQTTLTPYSINKQVTKIIAIDSDITSLKNYERRLELAKDQAEKADKLKTAFLSNMSHEIRTPLNGILGFTELLQINADIPEKRVKYLAIIRSNSEQLLKIIEDILDISMIESEQMKFNLNQFKIHGLLYQIYETFKSNHEHLFNDNLSLKFENRLPDNTPSITTDQYRITQVVENLLRNALKFTSKGYILVGCQLNESHYEIFVEDTGLGVDDAVSDIIFTQFRQGDERLKRQFGGAGLGLAISKGLIELLGGTIWLDKTYTGGARFVFSLPLEHTVPIPVD